MRSAPSASIPSEMLPIGTRGGTRAQRFLQVHRVPGPAELARPALRRWLRAVTALQWYALASAVELSDPGGRYAYVPLDA